MAGQRGEGPSAQQHRGALSRLTSCLAAPRFGCMRNARLPAVDQVTKTDVQSDAVVAEFDQVQAPDRQLHNAPKGLLPAQALGRTEERRVGEEGVSKCRYRGQPSQK